MLSILPPEIKKYVLCMVFKKNKMSYDQWREGVNLQCATAVYRYLAMQTQWKLFSSVSNALSISKKED